MSRSGRITRAFGDGRYEFFLNLAGLDELDEKTGVGPGTLLRRMSGGDFRARDMREVIRLSLIGGGQKPVAALKLVERYCDPPNALMDSLALALEILTEAVYAPGSQRKKKQDGDAQAETTTASISKPSMETVQ